MNDTKTLALLLVAAIVVSLGGTMVSLDRLGQLAMTGRATTVGTATVTITATSIVDVTDTTVAFGSDSLAESNDVCFTWSNTSTTTPADCADGGGAWGSAGTDVFTFENTGSSTIDVDVTSSDNAADFLGSSCSTGKAFGFSCSPASGTGQTTLEFSKTSQNCVNNLVTTDGSDTGNMALYVNITSGCSGTGSATITFAAS